MRSLPKQWLLPVCVWWKEQTVLCSQSVLEVWIDMAIRGWFWPCLDWIWLTVTTMTWIRNMWKGHKEFISASFQLRVPERKKNRVKSPTAGIYTTHWSSGYLHHWRQDVLIDLRLGCWPCIAGLADHCQGQWSYSWVPAKRGVPRVVSYKCTENCGQVTTSGLPRGGPHEREEDSFFSMQSAKHEVPKTERQSKSMPQNRKAEIWQFSVVITISSDRANMSCIIYFSPEYGLETLMWLGFDQSSVSSCHICLVLQQGKAETLSPETCHGCAVQLMVGGVAEFVMFGQNYLIRRSTPLTGSILWLLENQRESQSDGTKACAVDNGKCNRPPFPRN